MKWYSGGWSQHTPDGADWKPAGLRRVKGRLCQAERGSARCGAL